MIKLRDHVDPERHKTAILRKIWTQTEAVEALYQRLVRDRDDTPTMNDLVKLHNDLVEISDHIKTHLRSK